MRSIKRLMPASMLLCAILILSACATTTGSDATKPVQGADTYCQIALPIGWSSQDTEATIREVKAHNAVWLRLCKRE